MAEECGITKPFMDVAITPLGQGAGPAVRTSFAVKSKWGYTVGMIDKITPGPSEEVIRVLREEGLEDVRIVRSSKGVPLSAVVNAEEFEMLAIEDNFPNGVKPRESANPLTAITRSDLFVARPFSSAISASLPLDPRPLEGLLRTRHTGQAGPSEES